MKKIKRLSRVIREKSIVFSASLVLILVVVNAGFLYYSNSVQEQAVRVQADSQEIKRLMELMWDDVVRNLDLGLRGFALTQDEGLLVPYNKGKELYLEYSTQLEAKLKHQENSDLESFNKVKQSYREYMKTTDNMVELVRRGNMDAFKEELKLDKGLTLWRAYEAYATGVNQYQDSQYAEASAQFLWAKNLMLYLQVLLAIISIPTLIFMIIKMGRDGRARRRLFIELEENNRNYIFNPGSELSAVDERELINSSIDNFKKAASFISQISSGNLEVNWEALNDENRKLNQTNLVGELIQMREKMKQLKSEDARRMWATEGLAQFSEIIRKYQHELATLCDQSISYIVKYLDAQQGAIFLLQEDEDEKYLEMAGCYAFDRKKYVEKRTEVGQGLVGQVYLEKESVMLTKIPQAYTFITSGLGEATPNCLLLVPMKYNEKVEAVIEIAGFKVYEPYQLEWLEKIGEIMASSIVSIRSAEKTQVLLNQFKEQTEQLSAQEEELRQNMEEMEATQEEMRRKEQELERRQKEMQELLSKKKA